MSPQGSGHWYDFLKDGWIAGDFPSWVAVLLGVAAIVLARRALAPPSYLEFHRDWEVIMLKNGKSAVKGRMTGVSHAAYFQATGRLQIYAGKWFYALTRWKSYPLVLVERVEHMIHANTTVLTLEAQGFDGSDYHQFTRPIKMKLDILAQFSDGTKKRMRSRELELTDIKSLNQDDVGKAEAPP